MKRPTTVVLLCVLLLLSVAAQAGTIIDPTDPNIRYTGRWDMSTPSQPWSYWIGASLIAEFEGTAIAITTQAGWSGYTDYLRIIIDDDRAGSTKIAVPTTTATYTLASNLTDAVHKVEIIKETDVGYWSFHSFELDDDRSLVTPQPRPQRKITFYGDSNLAGYSLESEQNESGYHLRGTYNGYAGILSRMFDAEYENISRSGATISDIHGVFGQIDYWYNTPVWDFDRFLADVVVVGLGANDLGSPEQAIRNDYHAFLDDLRAEYPDAHIVLYNGWGWDYDEPANYTHEVVAERNDSNLSYAIFPWIFEQWHGCEYDHAGMALILADHLSSVLGWSQQPPDIMNGYGHNGNVANGSFEEVAPFGGYGWRYYTHSAVSRIFDPSSAYSGEHFLRLADGAASHQPIPANDGETFTVSVWMRGNDIGDQADITMDFRDQKMWTAPLQSATETRALTIDWQQFSMTATAPTGTTNPVYHTRVTFTAATGSVVDIDDVVMTSATGALEHGSLPAIRQLTVSPNPFNPRTRIIFEHQEASPILLTVHDVSGRQVATLATGHHHGGTLVRTWDGRDDHGCEVSSGTYFARMVAGQTTATEKMVLIR